MHTNTHMYTHANTQGDYGFRTGASVPRPMLVDFTRMPETKIKIKGQEVRAYAMMS
jgi:hypothetical protein